MSLWRQLTGGLRVLARRDRADRDLDDELRHFIDEATDAYVARGLAPGEARRAAHRDMGGRVRVREEVRDHGWEHVAADWLSDIRVAARMLRRTPVFAAVVVLVVAIGSGAVTTIFSAMNAVVLRPLPGVADPAGLITIRPARADGVAAEQGSYAYYDWLRGHVRTLSDIAAWGRVTLSIATGGEAVAAEGHMVTASYFDALGVRPAIGRFFDASEVRSPGGAPLVIVSHSFWRDRLGGDPGSVGRAITVNGAPYTLIGVAPAGFRGIYTGLRADAWVPVTMQPHLRPRANLRDGSWLWLFGRLAPGATRERARLELSALSAARAADLGLGPRAFDRVRVGGMTGLPNGEGGPLLAFMGVLLAGAALLLAIGGIDIAAMLSARYSARAREISVRAALGAGRVRLLRAILTEVVILFLLGSFGGFLIASGATAALERLPLPANIPVVFDLSPDLRVFAFGVAVALIAGLLFGLPPARRAAGGDLTMRLRDGCDGAGPRRGLTARALVVGQVALSLVLLVAAGLFMRALAYGSRIDPGFEPSGVAVAALEAESWGFDEARARAFYDLLRRRVRAMPGVSAVSYTGRLPLMLGSSVEEISADGSVSLRVQFASVDVDYFDVLRLPIVRGRAFDRTDAARAPRVAVINETLARRLAPDGRAIGSTFRFREQPATVVGIARDARYASLDGPTPPFAYFPIAQLWQPTQVLLVRAADPDGIAPAIADVTRAIDPTLPRPVVTTLERSATIVLLPRKVAALATATLGVLGLLLAAVGLYGVLAMSAGRRTREIGVRIALGARPGAVRGMLLAEGMRLTGTGIVLGLALSALAARLIAGWLFAISPLDPATFASMSAIFVVVGFGASYLPARRAASADPLTTLRAE